MSADRFVAATQQVFSPMALLFVILVVLLLSGSFLYMAWRRRMHMMKRIEAQRRALVTIASHKLGGPIATLRWWSEILAESSKSIEDTVEARTEINDAIDRLSQVVQNLDDATQTNVTEEELRKKLMHEAEMENVES